MRCHSRFHSFSLMFGRPPVLPRPALSVDRLAPISELGQLWGNPGDRWSPIFSNIPGPYRWTVWTRDNVGHGTVSPPVFPR